MKSIVAVALFTFGFAGIARAADTPWKPAKPVEIVIGAQAGGAHDRSGRVLQKILTDTGAVSVPVNVMNKPGQGQTIAVAYTNTHAGDGHYLIVLGSSWVTTAINTGSTSTHSDLTPITKLFDTDLVMYVPADSPLRTVKDMAGAMTKGATPLSFGFSTSAGNASHIVLAEIARASGFDPKKLRVVVNASGSITATQVAGGHVNVGISSSGSAQAMSGTGKVRLIGAIAPKRLPMLPDLPTLKEQGYDVTAATWFNLFGPKGLSAAQVAYWESVVQKAMRHAEAKKFADANNWTIELTSAKELPAQLDREHARLRKTLVDLGMAQ
jgi:putative tricarboxylic transport membrane protein